MSDEATPTQAPAAPTAAPVATPQQEAAPSQEATAAEIVASADISDQKTEEVAKEAPAKKEKKAPALAKVKAREAAVESKAKEVEAREAKIKEFEAGFNKEAFKKNPTKFLAKYDLTFQDVAEAVLNEGEPETPKTDAQIALEKIQKMEEDKEAERLAREEAETKNKQAYIDRVFTDYKKRIEEHVDANEEKYELVKLHEKQDLVFEIQEAYHAKNGKILDLDKACEIAENHLLKSIQKVMGAKKLQKLVNPPKEANTAKTLSSNLAAATSSNSQNGQVLSRDERIRRAAEKLQFVN